MFSAIYQEKNPLHAGFLPVCREMQNRSINALNTQGSNKQASITFANAFQLSSPL